MSIDQVSTIKQTQPGLYQCISELKKLIIATGTVECQETSCGEDNRSKIKTLLDSPQNGNGEFYRYWFDEESEDEWVDPVGNNIILLAIARGAFNNTDRDSVVVPMVSAILDDLASKIKSPELLSEIVSFKCRTEKCYYDNSPLTIAINSGMIDIACRLLEMGSDANVTCYGKSGKEEGKYTAAHLVILRLPFVENPSKELKVLELLKLYKADFKAQDNFGRSVEDLVKTHNLHIEDMKCFRFKNEAFATQSGKTYKSDSGEVVTYSFRELHDGDFLRLYGKKLPSLDIEGFYEFKGSIREWLNCLVMPDASKICDVDIRQVAYDRVALPCAEAEYNFDLLYTCEEGSRERKCPHDHFHNTQHHETVCSIIGIDACHETHIL